MWMKFSKRCFRSFHFKQVKTFQFGQGVVEYILIIGVVVGIFLIALRPAMNKLGESFKDGLKGGVFAEDPTGANYYYFPMKGGAPKAKGASAGASGGTAGGAGGGSTP